MEKKQKPVVHEDYFCYHGHLGFPLLLILVGAFWLLKNLNIIPGSVSIWPVFLILLGIWMIVVRT